jgi:hypothetical protein
MSDRHQPFKDDLNDFIHRNIGGAVLVLVSLLGSFLWWNLADSVAQSSVSSANAERSISNQRNLDITQERLQKAVEDAGEQARENSEILTLIRIDTQVTKTMVQQQSDDIKSIKIKLEPL